MTLEQFIEARLTEDEQIARAAIRWDEGASQWADAGEPDWLLIARHDPARVLRQAVALRELFERAIPEKECRGHPGPWMPHGDYGPGYCGTPDEADALRVIAAIWSDHPDYRREWADTTS